MIAPRIVFGLLFSLLAAARLFAGDWQAGAAKVRITPRQPMWMSGYASRTGPAEGTQSDLYAKSLVLQDDAGHAEGGGRTQDGAHVLRVGHLVEHEDHRAGRRFEVGEFGLLQRGGPQRHALVDRALRQREPDLVRVGDLEDLLAAEAGLDLFRLVGRRQQPDRRAARRVGEGGLDRVPAPDPVVGRRSDAAFRTALTLCSGVEFPAPSGVVAFRRRGHYKTRSDLGPPRRAAAFGP